MATGRLPRPAAAGPPRSTTSYIRRMPVTRFCLAGVLLVGVPAGWAVLADGKT